MELQQTKRRRSSILKKSPHRKSLAELDVNLEPTVVEDDTTRKGLRRRVSFANTNQVKEICRIADITEKWPDSSSTVDTSNLDIQKLAISKNNKIEVGEESLNALMSAPILQSDDFSPSDIALLDETSGCSLMHASDHTSILYTPEATLQTNPSVLKDDAFVNNVEISVRESNGLIEDDVVVAPSFLKYHFSENGTKFPFPASVSDVMDLTEIKQSTVSNFSDSVVGQFTNTHVGQKTSVTAMTTSTPMPQPYATYEKSPSDGKEALENVDMEETACIKRIVARYNNREEISAQDKDRECLEPPALTADKSLDPVFSFKSVGNDDDMEQTACIKSLQSNENQNRFVSDNSSPRQLVRNNSQSAPTPNSSTDHADLYESEEMEMTECNIASDFQIYLSTNKENVAQCADVLEKREQHPKTKCEAGIIGNQNVSFDSVQSSHMPPVKFGNSFLSSEMQANQITQPPSQASSSSKISKSTSFNEDVEITRCIPKSTNSSMVGKTTTFNDDVEITRCLPANSSMVGKTTTFNDDVEITRCLPANSSMVGKTTTFNEDVEITRCLPKSANSSLYGKTTTFNEDVEITRCLPKSTNSSLYGKTTTFNDDVEITRCPPKSTNSSMLGKTTTFNDDVEITRCLPKSANSSMVGKTTTFNEDVEITRCLPKSANSSMVGKTTTFNEDVEITLCLPKSTNSSMVGKTTTFNDDVEITRCLPKSANSSMVGKTTTFNDDVEITRCLPKSANSSLYGKTTTFNDDVEITRCIPKFTSLSMYGKTTTFNDDVEITRCLPKSANSSLYGKTTTFNDDVEITRCLPKSASLEVPAEYNKTLLITNKSVLGCEDVEITHCLKSESAGIKPDLSITPACNTLPSINSIFSNKLDFTSCALLKSHFNTSSKGSMKENVDVFGNSSQLSFSKQNEKNDAQNTLPRNKAKGESLSTVLSKSACTSVASQPSKAQMLEAVKSFSATKTKLLKTGESHFIPTINIDVGGRHGFETVSVASDKISPAKLSKTMPLNSDIEMMCVSNLKAEKQYTSKSSEESRNSIKNENNLSSHTAKVEDIHTQVQASNASDSFNDSLKSSVVFKVGTPDISGISELESEKSFGNESSLADYKSFTSLVQAPSENSAIDHSLPSTQLASIRKAPLEESSVLEQLCGGSQPSPQLENDPNLSKFSEQTSTSLSPPLKRQLKEVALQKNGTTEPHEDVETKRIRIASDESGSHCVAANLTNNLLDQDSSQSISMEEFLDMYVNVRIGGDRKANRGKRSLVFPLRPSEKPTSITDMLRAEFDLEYQLPVYQQFQKSIRGQLQRVESEITELEENFKSSNPEIVKKIRFGDKEKSDKLVEDVDELGKQCKKLAKVHWKKAKNKLRKSLKKSWEVFEENEINPISKEIQQYGDINQLINNAKQEIEADRLLHEKKLADLQIYEPLPTEEQIQIYKSNEEKIHTLQKEISKQTREREDFEAATKKFNDTMARVWKALDKDKKQVKEREKRVAQEKARLKERLALERYSLWEIVEDGALNKSFSFLEDSLLFSALYSDEQKITSFQLKSCTEGVNKLDQFLHRLILGDDEVLSLLRYTNPSTDLAKALNIVSRKVASAVTLRSYIRRLSMLVSHCSFDGEENHVILAKFRSRKPNLCRFQVRFCFYDNEKDVTTFAPSSYQYVDAASFGKFGEHEILETLKEVNSPPYRLFHDYSTALLKLMSSPIC